MRATIRSVMFDPEPTSLSGDPTGLVFGVRLLLGPADGPGEESFHLTVCSPEWLAEQSRRDRFVDGRHHVIVNMEDFNQPQLHRWLDQRVSAVDAPTWREVGERLARLGYWEFEDYRE